MSSSTTASSVKASTRRERLLTLSDAEKTFSYCLLDTPIPLLNYVAHVALHRVTDGERTFWRWTSEFDAPRGQERKLRTLVGEDIYERGLHRHPPASCRLTRAYLLGIAASGRSTDIGTGSAHVRRVSPRTTPGCGPRC